MGAELAGREPWLPAAALGATDLDSYMHYNKS